MRGTLTHFTHINTPAASDMGPTDDKQPAETHRLHTALPTVSGYHTRDHQWEGALRGAMCECEAVSERDRERYLSAPHCVCVWVCVHACCVKTGRTYISASDSRLAGLNIWCRYELTVKYSCSGSSWVRVQAIVSWRVGWVGSISLSLSANLSLVH